MLGSSRVLRPCSIILLAIGLVFGFPTMARAQTPRFEPSRLPWQPSSPLVVKTVFDPSWERVVIDTQQLLRRFSAPHPFWGGIDGDDSAQASVDRTVWNVNVRTLVQQHSNPGRVDVAPVRITMTPVPFTSGNIVAESRPMEGSLAGVKFEWVD